MHKEMVKGGTLEGQEGRNNSGKSTNGGHTKHCYSPQEVSKSCVMIEAKMTTPSDTKDNGI